MTTVRARLVRVLGVLPIVAVAVSGLVGCSRAPKPEELSVVLVTLDTTRADRIGAFGGTGGLSPHLDKAARQGTIFAEAVSQVPLTLPAHSSILTGRYPASHGVRHNGIYKLRDSELTLAERLEAAGFDTAAFVGSYVLNKGFGAEQGFATYNDVPGDRFAGGEDRIYTAQRSADDVNEQVAAWLASRKDLSRRIFLWVHYYDPHDPYEPPDKPGATIVGEGYDREISYMDACFGDLIRTLDDHGLMDRSLLVVAGDHGESLGEHGEKQHGIFLYEGAVRIPMFLRAPGLVPGGGRVDGPVELVDIAPTILDYLDAEALPEAQGKSLRPRIEGKEDGVVATAHAESLMPRLEFGWSELRMIRSGRYKFIQAPRPELYDLRSDPHETSNLAQNDPERAAELSGLLDLWVGGTTDQQAEEQAARKIDPEEEAKLRSLGYLGGDYFRTGGEGDALVDPKDGILEMSELNEARTRLREGDPARTLEISDRLIAARPLNHVARWTRIMALIELGRLPEAQQEALQALAAAEADPKLSGVLGTTARDMLAKTLRLQGRFAEAEDQYRRILEAEPENRIVRVDLARLLIDAGRSDEARRIVDEVLAIDPRDGMALNARYLLERRAGDFEAAMRTALLIAEVRAGDPVVLADVGGFLAEAKRPVEAAVCFELALTQLQDLEPDLLVQLGTARLASGDLDGAEEALKGAQTLRPRDARVYYYLGTIALSRDDEPTGRALLDRALDLAPGHSGPRVVLGRWLVSRGRREEAVRAFEDALFRNPDDRSAAEMLRRLRSGDAGE